MTKYRNAESVEWESWVKKWRGGSREKLKRQNRDVIRDKVDWDSWASNGVSIER